MTYMISRVSILIAAFLSLQALAQAQVTCMSGTCSGQISDGAHDAQQLGTIVHTTVAQSTVIDATTAWLGLYWPFDAASIGWASWASVDSGTIDVSVINANNDEPDHLLYCEDSATPATFSSGNPSTDIEDRTATTASTTLSSTDAGAAADQFLSEVITLPDISAILEELRASYGDTVTGFACIFQGSADAARDLAINNYEYDDQTHGAILSIGYTAGAAGPTAEEVHHYRSNQQ